MHDPFSDTMLRIHGAPRPSMRKVRAWVTIGMALALIVVAVGLVGLCWKMVSYIVHHVYRGFGRSGTMDHMFDSGRRIRLILTKTI